MSEYLEDGFEVGGVDEDVLEVREDEFDGVYVVQDEVVVVELLEDEAHEADVQDAVPDAG